MVGAGQRAPGQLEPSCAHSEGVASFPGHGCVSRGLRLPEDTPPGDPWLSAHQAAVPPPKNCRSTGQVCDRLRFVGNFPVRVPEREGGRPAEPGKRESAPRVEGLWLFKEVGLSPARTAFPEIVRPTGLEGYFFWVLVLWVCTEGA